MTMFSTIARHLLNSGIGTLSLLLTVQAQADGMVPNTSVVIVNEADGEASVTVTNTDSTLALMHVTIEDIPEDTEPLAFVTRLERFVLVLGVANRPLDLHEERRGAQLAGVGIAGRAQVEGLRRRPFEAGIVEGGTRPGQSGQGHQGLLTAGDGLCEEGQASRHDPCGKAMTVLNVRIP